MDKEVKREIILEHYQNPFHKEEVNDSNYKMYNTSNPNCIDNLDLYVKIKDNIIEDIKFMGEACAISTAATSIMIKNLIGKSIVDAKEYINNYKKMCNNEEYDDNSLNEALAFSDIYKQSNRINCAILPYKGILKAIEDYEKE